MLSAQIMRLSGGSGDRLQTAILVRTGNPDDDGWVAGRINRREALGLAGMAGLGAILAGCTPSDGPTAAPSSPATATTQAPKPTFARLARQLSGTLALPGTSEYRPKDLLYNPRFLSQREPAAIALVANAADVAACVRFSAEGGGPLRIRNGGHSYGGWSSGPNLVVDLTELNSVEVDESRRTATIGAGARLAEVYSELGAKGVSIGGGSCATVGITGLTLGGGVGVLARTYGLTCDQLASVQVVTADGRTRTVDADTDGDLFWALRGGGGGFGAVTALTFNVRPAPRIQTFFLEWTSLAAAQPVLAAWQEWIGGTPRELWSTCKLLVEPGQGSRVLVAGTWIGSGSPAAQLNALLAQTPRPAQNSRGGGSYGATMLAEAGCSGESANACISRSLDAAHRQPFAASSSILQKTLATPGVQSIVQAVQQGSEVADMVEGGVSFDAFGGAIAEPASDATAFPWRSALADIQYTATWPSALAGTNPARFDNFVQSMRRALQPYVGNAAYVNYADPHLRDYAVAYWDSNLPRLTSIKRTYDPQDVFSFPQSVPL